MKKFAANIFVMFRAENLEEAKNFIDKILNADFGKNVNEAIEVMNCYDSITGQDYDIWEVEEDD